MKNMGVKKPKQLIAEIPTDMNIRDIGNLVRTIFENGGTMITTKGIIKDCDVLHGLKYACDDYDIELIANLGHYQETRFRSSKKINSCDVEENNYLMLNPDTMSRLNIDNYHESVHKAKLENPNKTMLMFTHPWISNTEAKDFFPNGVALCYDGEPNYIEGSHKDEIRNIVNLKKGPVVYRLSPKSNGSSIYLAMSAYDNGASAVIIPLNKYDMNHGLNNMKEISNRLN